MHWRTFLLKCILIQFNAYHLTFSNPHKPIFFFFGNCRKFPKTNHPKRVDYAVDSQQQDKKYVFVRYNSLDSPLEIKTRFLSVRELTQRGAEGLFNVILSSPSGISEDIIKTKFAGITTDGESANTGRLSGLWARLEHHVGHETFNVWCTCHRSDLAMDDIFHCVPELEHWQSNLSSLATFYRVSGLRIKELRNILPEMVIFPRHHEVRCAQHLLQLVLAAIKNIARYRQHWQKFTDSPRGIYDKKKKPKCTGFSRVWKPFGMQEWLTTFMADICSIFRYLEKSNQKPNTIIPDILRYKKVALQKLDLLEEKPYPGKMLLNLMIK